MTRTSWRLWKQVRPGARRPSWAAMMALALAASLAGADLAAAQPSPAVTCEIPAAVGNALPPASGATPAAAPDAGVSVIQIEGTTRDAATPASLPVATPVTALPEQPAPDPLAQRNGELRAVSDALAACLSAGDAEMVTRLAGERYLGQIFGSSVPFSRDDYLAIAAELAPVETRIVDLSDVEQTSDDRATAVVTQVVGNQLMRAEWTFTQAPRDDRSAGQNPWLLASERPMPVEAPRGADTIEVDIGNGTFTLDEPAVDGPDVVLRGRNSVAEDHEMLVLRFDDGFTTDDLLRAAGPDLPAEVTFIGEMPVPAGGTADLVLVDLEPGAYTIVCLFPNADGLPFLADGMEATFTVE